MTRTPSTGPAAEAPTRLEQLSVPSDPRGIRFVSHLLGVALAVALVTAGMYVYVDPHDQYRGGAYPPIVVDWTESKLNMLDDQDDPPATLILGSSRAMAISPGYTVESGLAPGPAFSLAIPSSTWQDQQLLLEHLVSEGTQPETLVVALELDPRADAPLISATSTAYPRLTGTQSPLDEISKIGRAFSISGILDTARVLYANHVTRHTVEQMVLLDDGGTAFPAAFEERQAAHRVDLEHGMALQLRHQIAPYYDTDDAATRFMAFAEELADQASDGSRVHVFLPPVHPKLAAVLDERLPWIGPYEEQAVAALKGLCSDHFTVYDYRNIETFDGDPDDFFDGWHYLDDNAVRIVDAMAAGTGSLCVAGPEPTSPPGQQEDAEG